MEVYAGDTTSPPHVRTIYKSFYLHSQTTEIALATIIDDCLNPQYTGYRSSLVVKAARALGRNPEIRAGEVQPVWKIMEPLMQGRLSPEIAFKRLMALQLSP